VLVRLEKVKTEIVLNEVKHSPFEGNNQQDSPTKGQKTMLNIDNGIRQELGRHSITRESEREIDTVSQLFWGNAGVPLP
jgi:hypothetical protein